MSNSLTRRRPDAAFVVRIIGIVLFAYFFFGFMPVSYTHLTLPTKA